MKVNKMKKTKMEQMIMKKMKKLKRTRKEQMKMMKIGPHNNDKSVFCDPDRPLPRSKTLKHRKLKL